MFVGFVFLLGFLGFVIAQTPTCTDSDVTNEYPDGRNYYVKGTTTGTGHYKYGDYELYDKCGYEERFLTEYYCSDGELIQEDYNCLLKCKSGACTSGGWFSGCTGSECYDFDTIEVVYAAEFTANPVHINFGDYNLSERQRLPLENYCPNINLSKIDRTDMSNNGFDSNNWIVTNISGGINESITVLYGVVKLKKWWGKVLLTEGFIRIDGSKGKERFLLNYEKNNQMNIPPYRDDPSIFKDINGLYSSGKIMDEGNVLIQDYSQPLKTIFLFSNFTFINLEGNLDASAGKLDDIILYGQYGENEEMFPQLFLSPKPNCNIYRADLSTLKQTGNLFYPALI